MADFDRQSSSDVTAASFIATSRTRYGTIRQVTMSVLERMSPDELKEPKVVETEVLEACNDAIEIANSNRPKGRKWGYLDALLPSQIADAIKGTYPIVRVVGADEMLDGTTDLIAIYQDEGPDEGIYSSDEAVLRNLIRKYSYKLQAKDVSEVVAILQDTLPRRCECSDVNLVPVNNGIFDYDAKELMPFSPDYVFLSKSKVNYNDQSYNMVIHNPDDNTDWDVESWMDDLSDDPEIVHVLWQILGAIIRPHVPWNKSAWLYSESGNNGKGTLCELMRQLCGKGSYASISLSDFSKDFMLEPLLRASSIIVDENDVGTYIDKAANLKAVCTGDTVYINRKFKTPIAYQFKGFMVQCLNEMPRIRDRSDSFFRRQLFIPFTKCFTGKERKYIKTDYLHRQEVLEYVLYKVLNMNYYELDVPAACAEALSEYKLYVDPVRAFLDEMMPRVKWDLLPFGFLYDLYVSWYKATNAGDYNVKSQRAFVKDVRVLIASEYPAWDTTTDPLRTGTRMNDAEPLILEYKLSNWENPLYAGESTPDRRCHPLTLASSYRGVYRLVQQNGSDEDLLAASDTEEGIDVPESTKEPEKSED